MKKALTGVLLTALLYSCSDTILDKKPLDIFTEASVWGDTKLTQLYLNNIYTGLPDGFNRGWYMLDAGSDDAENSYGWPDSQAFNRGDYSPSNSPLNGTWDNNYTNIRKTNTFLSRIDAVPGDTKLKDQMKGEAQFLRALFYFELVKTFGGVPLITQAQTIDDDLLVSRNSYDECVAFIVKETNEAAAVLPEKYEGADVGRSTKGACMALKARTLLYAGKWAEAATAAKAIMDMKVYNLDPNYQRVFLTKNNDEIIFDVQHKQPESPTNVDLFNNPIGYGGWGGTCPTQEFVDTYELTDGKSISESPLYNQNDPYKNLDSRFYTTVQYDGLMWKNRPVETYVGGEDGLEKNGDATKTGYYMRKFLDESIDPNVIDSQQNWVLFRYAEVLLNYAEAQNEATGPDGSVHDAVNQVRTRAKLPALPKGLTQAQMRERVRKERRVELSFEEHRFWDVRRWKIAEKVLDGPATGMRITKDGGKRTFKRFPFEERVFNAKHYLFPIPQTELDKNPKLVQNQGW